MYVLIRFNLVWSTIHTCSCYSNIIFLLQSWREHSTGVRSGIAAAMTTEGTVSARRRVVVQAIHPLPRFSPGVDLDLWITRFAMYLKQTNIAEDQWTAELLPMLNDEPFSTYSLASRSICIF